ncbi:MAG: hypothetical protein ACREPM_17225, partial [Gemmatimonadaceae bacterium]
VHKDLKHVVLAHLSEENNSPTLALTQMRGAMARTKFKGTVTAAKQDAVVGPFTPSSSRADKAVQYSLF